MEIAYRIYPLPNGTIYFEEDIKTLDELRILLERSINPDAPMTLHDGDIIKVNYALRTDLVYIVNYFEKDTDNEIAPSKVVPNQVYGTIIDANSEAQFVIDGFTFDSSDVPTLTIGDDNQYFSVDVEGKKQLYAVTAHGL